MMMMGRKKEREREGENMAGGGNDCRHWRGLSLTMEQPTTVRGGHGLERKKEKK